MKRPAVIVAILSLAGLVVVAQMYLPLPLLGSISRTYGISTAGLVSSVFGVGYAFGFLLFGALSDRFGRRVVMVPGLVVLALASLLVTVADLDAPMFVNSGQSASSP